MLGTLALVGYTQQDLSERNGLELELRWQGLVGSLMFGCLFSLGQEWFDRIGKVW